MTDKETIHKVLSSLRKNNDTVGKMCYNQALQDAKTAFDSLQEEPVSKPIDFGKELYKAFGQVKDFALGMLIAKWFYDMGKNSQEPVSEDLEEAGREWLRPQLDKYYACYGETKMMELTRFDGYAMLDAIEFGAQWQKQRFSVEHEKELLNAL